MISKTDGVIEEKTGEIESKLDAIRQYNDGRPVVKISQEMHVANSTIYKWINIYRKSGRDEFFKHPGAPKCLSEELIRKINEEVLTKSPLEFNLHGSFWTARLLVVYIHSYCNIDVSVKTAERIMKSAGYNKEDFIDKRIKNKPRNTWILMYFRLWSNPDSSQLKSKHTLIEIDGKLVLKNNKPSERDLIAFLAYNILEKKVLMKEVDNLLPDTLTEFINDVYRIQRSLCNTDIKDSLPIILLKDTPINRKLYSRIYKSYVKIGCFELYLTRKKYNDSLIIFKEFINDLIVEYRKTPDRNDKRNIHSEFVEKLKKTFALY